MEKLLSKLDKALCRAEELSIGICLLCATALISMNVILRFFFRAGFTWSDELVRYLMIYITFVGCSVCVRSNDHIAVDVVSLLIKPEKGKKALYVGVNLVGVVFSLAMSYFGILLVGRAIKNPQVSPGLMIPMWIPYLCIPIGFMLMALRYTQDLIGNLLGKDFFAEYRKRKIEAVDDGEMERS